MALRERSAGVIVFRVDTDDIASVPLYLLLDYGRYWDFAKGHVETGENDPTAALRELKEETGITDVTLLPGFAREIVYFFKHPKRGLIRKEVVFFLGRTNTERVIISHEHVGFVFLPYEQAHDRLKYPAARELLEHAQTFITAGKP